MSHRELPDPEARWERTLPRADDLRRDPFWRSLGLPAPQVPADVEVLSGGQANGAVRVCDADGERLLRRYLRDPGSIRIEYALLQRKWQHIRVPRVLSRGTDHLWLEFIAHGSVPETYEGGLAAGRAAAEIHGMVFWRAGFLDENLAVVRPMPDVWQAFRDHIDSRQIADDLKQRVLACWDRHKSSIIAAASDVVLLHGDFKPANLGWTSTGELLVLDWEFAWAGPALLDLGQLLRWNPSMDFVEGVVAAYTDRAPVDLRTAEIFDLVNLVGLLHGSAAHTRRHRDVTERIEQTLGNAPGLRSADAADRAWANARYDEIGFLPSTPADLLLTVLWQGERAGMGRVVSAAPGVGELGGMYVVPALRGRKIGARLLRALQERSSHPTLFCIPFTRLSSLYEAAGFRTVTPEDAVPAAITRKYQWCETAYPEPVSLLVWRRNAASATS